MNHPVYCLLHSCRCVFRMSYSIKLTRSAFVLEGNSGDIGSEGHNIYTMHIIIKSYHHQRFSCPPKPKAIVDRTTFIYICIQISNICFYASANWNSLVLICSTSVVTTFWIPDALKPLSLPSCHRPWAKWIYRIVWSTKAIGAYILGNIC